MGFTTRQLQALLVLAGLFLISIVIRRIEIHRDLPQIDPVLEARFIAISDSLNSIDPKSRTRKASVRKFSGPVQINTAKHEELQRLPGVGTVLARRIIEFRKKNGPIKDASQLLKIQGIGKKKLEKMQSLIIFNDL